MEPQRIVQVTYIGEEELSTRITVFAKVSGETLDDRHESHDSIYSAIEFLDEHYMDCGFEVEHSEIDRDAQGQLTMRMTISK